MAKEGTTNKELFTIIGQFKEVDGEHRFVPSSPTYFRTASRRAPLGKPVAVTFSTKVPTRSQAQLRYHWVLVGYIAEHTGYTKEEVSDLVLRNKFGVKTITINGLSSQVRQSISEIARFPKMQMMELIEYDLEIARELGVHVPTMEELGFIPN